MELAQLRNFTVVVEYGTLTAAAERLFISQPALSRQIRALEQELGVRLFERERGSRQLSLTYAGERFLDHVRKLLDQFDQTHTIMGEVRKGEAGLLRLAGAPASLRYLVVPALATFRAVRPGVDIQLTEADYTSLLGQVVDSKVDIAVGAIVPSLRDVHWEKLFTTRMYALLSPEHRLANRPFFNAEELADEELLLFTAGRSAQLTRDLVFRLIHLNGLPSRPVFGSNIPDTILSLAELGIGVAIATDIVELRGFKLRAIPVLHDGQQVETPAVVAWRRGHRLPEAARAFVSILREQASHRETPGYEPWPSELEPEAAC